MVRIVPERPLYALSYHSRRLFRTRKNDSSQRLDKHIGDDQHVIRGRRHSIFPYRRLDAGMEVYLWKSHIRWQACLNRTD
jgi:hypothetical protein